MTLDQINQIFNIITLGLIIKLFLLVLIFFYFAFAFVVYREIRLMTQILNSSISPYIRLAAVAEIVSIAVIFFLTLVLV